MNTRSSPFANVATPAAHHCPTRRAVLLSASLSALLSPWQLVHAAGSQRPFREGLGLGVKFSQGQPLADLPTVAELGVRWVRDAIVWPRFEPSAGSFVGFSDSFKRQLAFYRSHDIGLVALLTLENSVAYPPRPGDPSAPFAAAAFGRFATEVARALTAAGVAFVLEIGNEPHNSSLSRTFGGAWNGKLPSPWVDHYVRMAAEAVTQVKAFDPAVRLMTNDDMWVVHYWFLEAGLPPALDAFSVHPYTPLGPEGTAIEHNTDWVRPFSAVDPDRSFGSAVRRLREQGAKKLGHSPEIWVTEWGWRAKAGPADSTGFAERTVAAYLPRAFILAEAAGVEATCWFSAHDAVDGPMGLTDNRGRRRDAFFALRTLSQQLGSYRLSRLVGGSVAPSTGWQAWLFSPPNANEVSRRKLVLWSNDEQTRLLRLPTTVGADGVISLLGEHVAPHPTDTGWTVPVGPEPLYIEGLWTDANLNASLPLVD